MLSVHCWWCALFSFTPPLPYPALQFDAEAEVAAMWREVWEECTSSAGAGLRLHMGEVVQVGGNASRLSVGGLI